MTAALLRLTENTSMHLALDSRTFGYALSSDAFQALLSASQRVECLSDGCLFFSPSSRSFLYPWLSSMQCFCTSNLLLVGCQRERSGNCYELTRAPCGLNLWCFLEWSGSDCLVGVVVARSTCNGKVTRSTRVLGILP